MKLKDQAKKESIRQATLNVVLNKGIAGVKMAVISKAVGLSVSTLYVYHKNKEELLISIYLQIFKERLAVTNPARAVSNPAQAFMSTVQRFAD